MAAKAKLQKWGNSHGIRIPKKTLEEVGIEPDNVETEIYFKVSATAESITLTPIKTKISYLESLFIDYDFKDKPAKADWSEESVGKEFF